MSPVMKSARAAAICIALLALVVACSKKHDGSPFDPTVGHGENWLREHPAAFQKDSGTCLPCHGADLMGGISGISCYSASFEGQSCHPSGPGGPHAAGWGLPRAHGSVAKAAPGAASGFAWCRSCHGAGFAGGVGLTCFGCHGWNAPHGKTGWVGGAPSHTGTNPGNAPVCSQCHASGPGTPGCFNNTLCHGPKVSHPAGWDSPGSHGAAAKGSPGMASCEGCHGTNFGGGSGRACAACHGTSRPAPHPRAPWRGTYTHTTTNEVNAPVCAQCHRTAAGTAGCFNNTLCHGAQGNHPAGWSAVNQHGAAAQSNMGSCQRCHGGDYAGGTSGQSCFPCHGWNAAHGQTGWTGGGSHHEANSGNAPACAVCHRHNPGTANCFNNTLCHGNKD
jgi:hypothetical protein